MLYAIDKCHNQFLHKAISKLFNNWINIYVDSLIKRYFIITQKLLHENKKNKSCHINIMRLKMLLVGFEKYGNLSIYDN